MNNPATVVSAQQTYHDWLINKKMKEPGLKSPPKLPGSIRNVPLSSQIVLPFLVKFKTCAGDRMCVLPSIFGSVPYMGRIPGRMPSMLWWLPQDPWEVWCKMWNGPLPTFRWYSTRPSIPTPSLAFAQLICHCVRLITNIRTRWRGCDNTNIIPWCSDLSTNYYVLHTASSSSAA